MTNDSLKDLLREIAAEREMILTHPWPQLERLLDGAASRIERLEAENAEARQIVADCNNSLFGSQGYFTEAGGKTAASAIEDLKAGYVDQWRRAQQAEASLSVARGALEPFANFAADNTVVDPFDAQYGIWSGNRCERERIRDWFGPTDFYRTRQALLASQGRKDEGPSRIQPCADVQERSPEQPLSDGGEG